MFLIKYLSLIIAFTGILQTFDVIPKDVVEVGNFFYKFPSGEFNYLRATDECNKWHMELAVLKTKKDVDDLYDYMNKNSYSGVHWIGAHAFGNGDNIKLIWVWLGTGQWLNYYMWQPNQPDNWNGNEHCLNIEATKNENYNGMNEACNTMKALTKAPIICQITKVYSGSLKNDIDSD